MEDRGIGRVREEERREEEAKRGPRSQEPRELRGRVAKMAELHREEAG